MSKSFPVVPRRQFSVSLVVAAALVVGCTAPDAVSDPEAASNDEWTEYLEQHHAWQAERAESLVAENGWLALIGLYWLGEGSSRFGTGTDNQVVFPETPSLASAPPVLGAIVVDGTSAELRPEPGSGLVVNGSPIDESAPIPLLSDASAEPTIVSHGSVEFHLIERGGSLALRLRDRLSPTRMTFTSIESYDPTPGWVLDGRFEAFDEVREVAVPNVTPLDYPGYSAGEVVVDIGGTEHRLIALSREATGPLFLVLGDSTNGHATYGGGRYVYTSPPGPGDSVRVDLNRLYNPPCVFTEWATCPLPPPQNQLDVAIEAGEKVFQTGG